MKTRWPVHKKLYLMTTITLLVSFVVLTIFDAVHEKRHVRDTVQRVVSYSADGLIQLLNDNLRYLPLESFTGINELLERKIDLNPVWPGLRFGMTVAVCWQEVKKRG